MTRLHDAFDQLARQAPTVDLADRALRGAKRRRMGAYGSALVALVAVALSSTVLAGGLLDGSGKATISASATDVLPASGVAPLSHAYYNLCGLKWNPRKNTGSFAGKDCIQWQVVTHAGQTYRMPEALSFYTDQTEQNYMNTAAPLAITPDGRWVAYYSEKDQKFAVRNLESGDIRLTPQTVTRAAMVAQGGLLHLSPDGRFLGLNGFGGLDAIVDMETGQVTEPPTGWHVYSVAAGGSPALLVNERSQYRLVAGENLRPFSVGDSARISDLAPDGRRVAYVLRGESGPTPEVKDDPPRTIVTRDATTGKKLSEVRLRDTSEGFRPWRIAGWLNPTEVVVSTVLGDRSWNDERTGRPLPGRVPTLGEVTHAIDVTTGAVRELRTYSYQGWGGDVVMPGF